MKKILLPFLVAFTLGANAQKAPWWYSDPPASSSNRYCYIPVVVNGGEDVLDVALPKAASCIGTGYKGFSKAGAGAVKVQTEVGERIIRYQRVYSQPGSYGSEYVLMMFSKEEMKAGKSLPKANRHFAPLSLALSAVLPGSGQFYKKQKGRGFLFLSSTLALGGAAFYFESERSSALDDYNNATTFDERETLIADIENNRNYRNYFLAGAGVIYAINLIDAVAFKGRRFAYNESRRVNWNVAYSPINRGNAMASLSIKLGD